VATEPAGDGSRVRAAELVAALSLATDLGIGVPLEHGLRGTIIAMRMVERLGLDEATASQTYYLSALLHIGCTADAHIAADMFDGDAALRTHFYPAMFGSTSEIVVGVVRALATPERTPFGRAARIVHGMPRLVRGNEGHLAAEHATRNSGQRNLLH
jgi:hypothetical protein